MRLTLPTMSVTHQGQLVRHWALSGSAGEGDFHMSLSFCPCLHGDRPDSWGRRQHQSPKEMAWHSSEWWSCPRRSQLTFLEGCVLHLVGPVSVVRDEALGRGPRGVGNVGFDVVAPHLCQGPWIDCEVSGGFTKHVCRAITQRRTSPTPGTSEHIQEPGFLALKVHYV